MPVMNHDFGPQLRTMREHRQLSLRKCAESIGVSATYLSKIERGELPPPSEATLREIARVIDHSPDKLLALAGRVPEDVTTMLKEDPFLVDLVRRIRLMSPEKRQAVEGAIIVGGPTTGSVKI